MKAADVGGLFSSPLMKLWRPAAGEQRREPGSIINAMSHRVALTLSVAAVLNYLAMAMFLRWEQNLDGELRFYFDNRKWTLSFTDIPPQSVSIKHWQTVNTIDFSVDLDELPTIFIAIGPLVAMYLCYRCGLVRPRQLRKI